MLNLSRLSLPVPLNHTRRSRRGVLFYCRGQSSYALTGWPELASFSNHYNLGWRPDSAAADRVFQAYTVPYLYLRAEGPLLLQSDSGQYVMPEIVSADSKSNDCTGALQLAWSRIDEQWRRDFESTVPTEFLAIATRFRRHPAAILRLLAACPEAVTLANANPALFFELACYFDRPSASHALKPAVLELLRQSQRQILTTLGLPGSESFRKFAAKMPPEDVCSAYLQSFSRAFGDRQISRWLPHLPATRHVAQMVSIPEVWPYLSPQLLLDVLHRPRVRELDGQPFDFGDFWLNLEAKELVRRLQWFHRQVRKGAAPQKFRSFGEVEAIMPLWLVWPPGGFKSPQSFPPPPVGGSAEVMPITSPAELVEEGRSQKNCAGSPHHLTACARGEAYFYRVLSPERATAKIELMPGGRGWQITELRRKKNEPVGFGTLQAVCDHLGLPASPVWCRGESWWSGEPGCVCSPRKSQVAPRA